jgi:hypothetical protein
MILLAPLVCDRPGHQSRWHRNVSQNGPEADRRLTRQDRIGRAQLKRLT